MAPTTTLRMERTFDAPAHAVFEAWTSEEVMRRWLHGGHDWETPEASVDLRVGGALRVVMRNPHNGEEHGARGEYTLIEPPRRLAFTWAWDHEPEWTSQVEITFEETDGRTTVHFAHTGLRDAEAVSAHERGWDACFDNLERALGPQ